MRTHFRCQPDSDVFWCVCRLPSAGSPATYGVYGRCATESPRGSPTRARQIPRPFSSISRSSKKYGVTILLHRPHPHRMFEVGRIPDSHDLSSLRLLGRSANRSTPRLGVGTAMSSAADAPAGNLVADRDRLRDDLPRCPDRCSRRSAMTPLPGSRQDRRHGDPVPAHRGITCYRYLSIDQPWPSMLRGDPACASYRLEFSDKGYYFAGDRSA